jgi:hypothetical protein
MYCFDWSKVFSPYILFQDWFQFFLLLYFVLGLISIFFHYIIIYMLYIYIVSKLISGFVPSVLFQCQILKVKGRNWKRIPQKNEAQPEHYIFLRGFILWLY